MLPAISRDEVLGTRVIPVIGDSVVHVGRGLLDKIPSFLLSQEGPVSKASVFVVVSDDNVFSIYGRRLLDAFKSVGMAEEGSDSESSGASKRVMRVTVPAGEGSKCREMKAKIEDAMLAARCKRDTVVVALGGGVVGDLAGFCAATYMRGVPVVQIPTSVMAMVDSSVGGKTAINVPAGKNLVGAFHQPRFVFADMELLKSLSPREIAEGLAESVKMGCIRDSELFDLMEQQPEGILSLQSPWIERVIFLSVAHKAMVVSIDPHEHGLRAILNFGHTVGHAVEAKLSPQLLHGECVSVGSVVEAELARRLGRVSHEDVLRITDCLRAFGLPTQMPKGLELGALMQKMAVDKKNVGNMIRCTMLTSIGTSVDDAVPVDRKLMEQVVNDALQKSTPATLAAGEPNKAKKQKT
mmetsp:Transcript_72009/g.119898  ORF Transcript_72009/g.119898 Transcript_72009/m.119898 type:complete len:410 (-) Transcript_72009:171-1400(-)